MTITGKSNWGTGHHLFIFHLFVFFSLLLPFSPTSDPFRTHQYTYLEFDTGGHSPLDVLLPPVGSPVANARPLVLLSPLIPSSPSPSQPWRMCQYPPFPCSFLGSVRPPHLVSH